MADLVSYTAFDVNAINLYWYYYYGIASGLEKNVNVTFSGVTYPDFYGVQGDDGGDYLELDFLGSGLAQNFDGAIIAGTVNFIGEFDVNSDTVLWYASGFSASAASIYNAALTPSNADELSILQVALAGNDTITLSSFADRMSGYGGNDVITGGLGADILAGGGGSDTFRDTAAGLNGDTIADFSDDDKIIITGTDLAGFTYSLVDSHTLNFSGGTLVFSNAVSGLVATAAAGGGVQLVRGTPPPPPPPPPQPPVTNTDHPSSDFNGDDLSDVLWRSDAGAVVTFHGQSNGSFAGNVNFNLNPGLDWHVVGIGDFNGDGNDDILWRNDAGAVVDLLGQDNGAFIGNVAFNLNPGLDWHIEGTGDFNGDHFDDILWRNDAGAVVTLLGEAGGSFIGNVNFNLNPGLDWHIEGAGDFNGDGRDDILWRNDAGVLVDLLGQDNGSFIGNVNFTLNPGLDWHVIGTGDFNGDGYDDILWRNDAGTITDLLGSSNGAFVGNIANLNVNLGVDWQVASIGDFNGDGFDDLMLRKDDGQTINWLGQPNGGFNDNSAIFSINPGTDWHVQPTLEAVV